MGRTVMRLRAAPILKMLAVGGSVALAVILIHTAVTSLPESAALLEAHPWLLADLVHIPQFIIPFLIILWITRGKPRSYGFNLNEDSHLTHKRVLMLSLGVGLLFSLRYVPQIVRGEQVGVHQPVTALNVFGEMTFQYIVVGLSEETMFRGLIQTYLMRSLEGHVRIAGHDLHVGTVIGAVFWGLFHFLNLLIMPAGTVVILVILTTFIGLILGYAYQRTGSLLTTIMMHGMVFGVPLTVGYILYLVL